MNQLSNQVGIRWGFAGDHGPLGWSAWNGQVLRDVLKVK